MAVLTISAIPLGPELIDGIPMLVALETNMPATLFYTLDNSEPDNFSNIYLSPIKLPTENTVVLKVVGISGFDRGYLRVVFSTNSTSLHLTRRVDGYGAGVVVDAYSIPNVLTDGYGVFEISLDGDDAYGEVNDVVRSYDESIYDYDIVLSTTGVNGIGSGTAPRLLPSPQEESDWNIDSPNHQNVFFNPKSLFITIDGRDGYADQSVFIINRPNGSTRDHTKYLYGKELYEADTYISGGFVRSFYDYKNGLAVFYYYDSNETRWVRSVQEIDKTRVPFPYRRQFGNPFVFKWIYNKRTML
jgi:hypothetical protein